jgi:hypothetical protein
MEERLKNTILEEVKKRGLILEQKTKTSDFVEMISLLFHSQTQTHTFHLQTKSLSEHKSLNKYYETIDGLIDDLVESYQGKYSILKNYKTYNVENYKDTTSTINYLKDLCGKIEDLRDCCDDSYIQNQIDNVCQLINSTLYKLRFLK